MFKPSVLIEDLVDIQAIIPIASAFFMPGKRSLISNATYRNKEFILKYNNPLKKGGDYKISQHESLVAAFHKLLLGNQVPLTLSVFNKAGQRVGILSEKVKGLKHITECNLEDIFKVSDNAIILGRIMALAIFFEENDLHFNNMAFDGNGRVVRFDFDRSLWALTAKYVAGDTQKNEQGFEITAELLSELPFSQHRVSKWFANYPDFKIALLERKDFFEQMQNSIQDTFMFLAFMPDDLYKTVTSLYMTSDKDNCEKKSKGEPSKTIQYLLKRKNQLKNAVCEIGWMEHSMYAEQVEWFEKTWCDILGANKFNRFINKAFHAMVISKTLARLPALETVQKLKTFLAKLNSENQVSKNTQPEIFYKQAEILKNYLVELTSMLFDPKSDVKRQLHLKIIRTINTAIQKTTLLNSSCIIKLAQALVSDILKEVSHAVSQNKTDEDAVLSHIYKSKASLYPLFNQSKQEQREEEVPSPFVIKS